MRRRIRWLVAATSSAVIVSFLIPLGLLVRSLAEDRALAAASAQAQYVAVLIASVPPEGLADAIERAHDDSVADLGVALPNGTVLGNPKRSMQGDPLVSQARGLGAAFTATTPEGASILVPVATDAGVAVVRGDVTTDQLHEGVAPAWLTMVILGLGLFLVSLLAADQLGRRVSTPVIAVADVAHRLRGGEFDARAPVEGTSETVELGRALNQLADRLDDLLRAEREAAADLSHRLRTPITALRLDAEGVTDPVLGDRLREHVDALQHTVDTVVTEARRVVREDLPQPCDATAVVRDRVEFWRPLAEDQGRELHTAYPPDLVRVPISAADLADLLDNLLDNVFAHTPEGTALAVRLQRDPAHATLIVEDAGPGLPGGGDDTGDFAERGRSGSGSTGLGLAIVARIARSAGGAMQVGRSPLGGLSVRVTCPYAGE